MCFPLSDRYCLAALECEERASKTQGSCFTHQRAIHPPKTFAPSGCLSLSLSLSLLHTLSHSLAHPLTHRYCRAALECEERAAKTQGSSWAALENEDQDWTPAVIAARQVQGYS